MSRCIKKFSRFTTYVFFMMATLVVTSILSAFQSKRQDETSNIPALTPIVHADTPFTPPPGDTESSACGTGGCGCSCAC